MTIVNFSGAESGDFAECSASSGTVSVSSANKRTGAYAYRTNPTTTGTGSFTVQGADARTFDLPTVYVEFMLRIDTFPAANSEEIVLVRNTAAGSKMRLRTDSTKVLSIYNSGNVLVATGATALTAGQWYRIGMKCPTSGGSAAYELRLDGNVELSGSSTFNATNAGSVIFGKSVNRNSQTVDYYFDDIVINDTGFLGDLAVKNAAVRADGSATTWSIGAGSGSKYQVVDDLPHNSNTDYLLSTLSVGNADLVVFQPDSVSGISGLIKALKPFAVTARDGASNGAFKVQIKSSASTQNSASLQSASGYIGYGLISETDPATAAAWTITGYDNCEAGVVEDSSTNKTRATAIMLFALYAPQIYPNGISGTSLGSPQIATIETTGLAGTALGSPQVATIETTGLYGTALGSPQVATIETTGLDGTALGSPLIATIQTTGLDGTALGSPLIATIQTAGISSSSFGAQTITSLSAGNLFLFGGGVASSPPRFVSTATSAPSSAPIPTYPFGGPYSIKFLLLQSTTPNFWYFWRDLIWTLRLFPNVAGSWRTSPPLGCALFSLPYLCIVYDDLETDLVDPLVFFSTYASTVALSLSGSPVGAVEGCLLTLPIRTPALAPPSPPAPDPLPSPSAPFSLPPGGHKRLDFLALLDRKQSTIEAEFSCDVTDGAANPSFRLVLRTARSVFLPYLPDYSNPPKIVFKVPGDIFTSDYLLEQRTTALENTEDVLDEILHIFDYEVRVDGREESDIFWNLLQRGKHKRFAVPWFSERFSAASDVFGLTSFVVLNVRLADLIWLDYGPVGAEIVRFDSARPSVFQSRKLVGFDTGTNALTVDHPWTASIPAARQSFALIRSVELVTASRKNSGDKEQIFSLSFRSVG